MAEDTDFAALYRELGIDTTCSLAGLRGAWRRRVAKLHPDQGGDDEDTGRLQELNRLYDAALDFHTRFGRLPGATHTSRAASHTPVLASEQGPIRMASRLNTRPPAGFGKLSRYFIAVSLLGIAVLGWRITQTDDIGEAGLRTVPAADANSGAGERHPAQVAINVLPVGPGMDKQDVLSILGEPLVMHDLRWSYGPSWVEFHCGKVVGWYSSPDRPLRVKDAAESYADTTMPDNTPCD